MLYLLPVLLLIPCRHLIESSQAYSCLTKVVDFAPQVGILFAAVDCILIAQLKCHTCMGQYYLNQWGPSFSISIVSILGVLASLLLSTSSLCRFLRLSALERSAKLETDGDASCSLKEKMDGA